MFDVARLSGVSKGTVDRVLHGRSGVSESTKKKVLEVIREVGFMPNVYASLLSQKKSYKIMSIIPYFQKGDYWELVYDGIMSSIAQNSYIDIEINVIYYNQFDVDSFRQACAQTLALEPHAVLLAPIYKKEVRVFAGELSERSIPFAYVDSKIEDTDYLAYFGMSLFDSGYLIAHLLFDGQQVSEVVNFNVDRGGVAPNDSMIRRWEGFNRYIADHRLQCRIHDCSILPHDFMYNIKLFDSFFREHPDVKHIIALSSRAYIVYEWLEMRGIRDKKLFGFDMLEKNLEGLKKGYITTLITERTAQDVRDAMQTLINFLVFKTKPEQRDSLVSMDILNKYNVAYYQASTSSAFQSSLFKPQIQKKTEKL
jgi:LacI family transcriptional regulator